MGTNDRMNSISSGLDMHIRERCTLLTLIEFESMVTRSSSDSPAGNLRIDMYRFESQVVKPVTLISMTSAS